MTAFYQFHPVLQALLATLFTWFVTAAGAGLVFFTRQVNRKVMNGLLGMASGVMIAASFWSLLNPAIEMSHGSIIPALIGFLSGGAFLLLADKILPHVHPALSADAADDLKEGLPSRWRRTTLLVLAITLHNFPEGLAVGVAFGAAASGIDGATIGGAIALAIGIAIQNFPEGAAVAFPLRREGISMRKSWWIGQLSGIVEPVAGVMGAALVTYIRPSLPYALAFAAGAMIYVVAEELIPEAKSERGSDIPTIGVMVGFAIMMTLDVVLG